MSLRQNPWLALTAIGLLTVMENIDASIVNIAMPIMAQSLHVPLSQVAYVSIIYMVVLSGLLIAFGRLGDLWGKVRVFKIGTYVFILGSLLASFDFGFGFLLIARVVQSVGAAATLSNSYGLISQLFPVAQRGRAMGINTIFISAGYVAGPALGGVLLQLFSWHSIFFVNVPIGVVAVIMNWLFLHLDEHPQKTVKFDWPGAALLFLSLVTFFAALELAQSRGFTDAVVLGLAALFVVSTSDFVWVEKDVVAPTLDLSLFKNGVFTSALFVGTLSPIVNSLFSFIFPIYLQSYRGISVGITGAIVLLAPIVMALIAPLGGTIGDKTDKNVLISTGLAFMLVAQLGFYLFGPTTSLPFMVAAIVVGGIGTGLFIAPNTATIMATITTDKLGVAGATQTLAINFGNILGISLASLTVFSTMSTLAGYKVSSYLPNHPEWFITGVKRAFLVAAFLMALGLVVTLWRWRRERKAA